jgi:hypothetical protein
MGNKMSAKVYEQKYWFYFLSFCFTLDFLLSRLSDMLDSFDLLYIHIGLGSAAKYSRSL